MTEDNERAIIPYASLPISQEAVVYTYGPDSAPRPQVRPGQLTQLQLRDSAYVPGPARRRDLVADLDGAADRSRTCEARRCCGWDGIRNLRSW